MARQHQQTPQQKNQLPSSNGTGTSRDHQPAIVETLEHRRFAEFCDACRRYGYIGLCYGSPGVGKTLSAKSYSRWGKVQERGRWSAGPVEGPALDTIFYTPSVVNAPMGIKADITRARATLTDLAKRPLLCEKKEKLKDIQRRGDEPHAEMLYQQDWLTKPIRERHPTYGDMAMAYAEKEQQIKDPTTLILVDEADRLRLASLEQVRAIVHAGEIGVILIGMPGLEKRLARYPQFYSRIGFVHEFRPLAVAEIHQLLEQRWTPAGVHLPEQTCALPI